MTVYQVILSDRMDGVLSPSSSGSNYHFMMEWGGRLRGKRAVRRRTDPGPASVSLAFTYFCVTEFWDENPRRNYSPFGGGVFAYSPLLPAKGERRGADKCFQYLCPPWSMTYIINRGSLGDISQPEPTSFQKGYAKDISVYLCIKLPY